MTKHARAYDRAPDEWYVEPTRCTEQLIEVEPLPGVVLDPACGQGNIVTTLLAAGIDAYGSDIRDRAGAPRWFLGQSDFLKDEPRILPDHIVCNPPFYRGEGTEAFIRRALELSVGKVCIFSQTTFLHGSARATGLYRTRAPDRVWIITPRPSCPPGHKLAAGEIEAKGGTTDWAWFVWDNHMPVSMRSLPRLGWTNPEPHLRARQPAAAAALQEA